MARILVIDDEVQVRAMLRHTLEREGYKVVDAPDGKAVMRLCREQQVDLVIADLIMPEMEGIETIMELRREFPGVKIIAISRGGHVGPEAYLRMARSLGARRTFTKPFERNEMLEAVRQLVDIG